MEEEVFMFMTNVGSPLEWVGLILLMTLMVELSLGALLLGLHRQDAARARVRAAIRIDEVVGVAAGEFHVCIELPCPEGCLLPDWKPVADPPVRPMSLDGWDGEERRTRISYRRGSHEREAGRGRRLDD